jgi:YVTN family beta-propeller protein
LGSLIYHANQRIWGDIMKNRINLVVILLTLLALMVPESISWSNTEATTSSPLYFDMAVDDGRQLIYASDTAGGKIDVISTATLQVVASITVGSNPAGLDISPDGNELAVALSGQSQIAFIDLTTQLATDPVQPAVPMGQDATYDVMYGRAGRLYSIGNAMPGGAAFIHVFDTSAALKKELGRSTPMPLANPRFAMTADKNTLYVSQVYVSTQYAYRYDITSDTPVQTAVNPYGPMQVNTLCVMPDGKVYTSGGQIWSADLSTQLTSLWADNYDYKSQIECVPATHRAFITKDQVLKVIDTSQNTIIYQHPYPYNIGVSRSNAASTVLYLSTDQGIKAMRADFSPAIISFPAVLQHSCPDLMDQFNDPSSGWYTGNDREVTTEYRDGEYRVLSKQPYLFLFRAPTCERQSYTVEADMRWVGRSGSDIGLLVGLTSQFAEYYLIDFNTDSQQYAVFHRQNGAFYISAYPAVSQAIHPGTQSNHVKVNFTGTQFTVYVNGQQLTTVSVGSGLGMTSAGLAMAPYQNVPGADARFDNFQLTSLSLAAPASAGSMAAGSSAPAELFQPEWLKEIAH